MSKEQKISSLNKLQLQEMVENNLRQGISPIEVIICKDFSGNMEDALKIDQQLGLKQIIEEMRNKFSGYIIESTVTKKLPKLACVDYSSGNGTVSALHNLVWEIKLKPRDD